MPQGPPSHNRGRGRARLRHLRAVDVEPRKGVVRMRSQLPCGCVYDRKDWRGGKVEFCTNHRRSA